jgi:hypothetical protein
VDPAVSVAPLRLLQRFLDPLLLRWLLSSHACYFYLLTLSHFVT